MSLRQRWGVGARSVEEIRAFLDMPRPASVREMLRRQVAVKYVGFHCFGETDEVSGSDEPYFVFGPVPATLNAGERPPRTRIYEDIDSGRSVHDDIPLYTGAPLGLALAVSLFEHDQGDPDKFKDNVEKAVDIAHDKGVAALLKIPAAGPVLALLGTIASVFTGPALTHAINDLLGSADDHIGTDVIKLTPFDMLRLAGAPRQDFQGIQATFESALISGDGGSYKAYFDIIPIG